MDLLFNNLQSKKAGFTFIELMIVLLLIGVLAAIIIPTISSSTEDAKVNMLSTNIIRLRKAIDFYHVQHKNIYPGENRPDGKPAETIEEAIKGFDKQLTQYTDEKGHAQERKDSTHVFGPYLKGGKLPVNPFNNKDDVTCDISVSDITLIKPDGSTGWKFFIKIGVLIPNDLKSKEIEAVVTQRIFN